MKTISERDVHRLRQRFKRLGIENSGRFAKDFSYFLEQSGENGYCTKENPWSKHFHGGNITLHKNLETLKEARYIKGYREEGIYPSIKWEKFKETMDGYQEEDNNPTLNWEPLKTPMELDTSEGNCINKYKIDFLKKLIRDIQKEILYLETQIERGNA